MSPAILNSRDISQAASAPAAGTLVLLAALYCAQGLPSGLIAHSLPVLLRQQGVELGFIGLLKLLALPWMLKALWAPWVDRIASPRWGHRRGWILPLQSAVIACILLLALLGEQVLRQPWLPVLLLLLALINLAAATQDIATDGLAVRLLEPQWRGLGNSLQVGGYKIGMIVSGSGLLLVVGSLGWSPSLAIVAGLLILMLLPIVRFDELRLAPTRATDLEPQRGPRLLFEHYRGLLRQVGMPRWLFIVLIYKLGDALGSPMIKPMLVDFGWSAGSLGQLTLVSSMVGIGGALLGGALYARLGARAALIAFGVLQTLGLAAWGALPMIGAAPATVYAIALFEQLADGMSTVALFAAMMQWCRPEHEGADFTLQASIQVMFAGLIGSASGLVAQTIGFTTLFASASLLALFALVPLIWHRASIHPQSQST